MILEKDKDKIRIGDRLDYKCMLYEGKGNDKYESGTVIGVYPHHVLVRTRYGYDTSITNAELHERYGWS